MDQNRDSWLVPAFGALTGVTVAVLASYVGGFLGIGVAGLLIGGAAVRYDVEKDQVGGGFASPHLYAKQLEAHEQLNAEQHIERREGIRALGQPLAIAKTISIGLIALGFGGYFFL